MHTKDIKILWGRSGNRCAICKTELTCDGAIETIGEITHVISQSPDGPRGDALLPFDKRSEYSNLILLCPNHHSEIDKNPESWPTTKLQDIKCQHEEWVSAQLEQGHFAYTPIDNTVFLNRIEEDWYRFAGSRIWIIAALTPLSVTGESVDPLDDKALDQLNKIKLPYDRFWDPHVNAYDTRPDENGVSNVKLEKLDAGDGHKLSIFRNGHCEFLFCLESSVNSITQHAQKVDSQMIGSSRVIRYTHLAEVISKQIAAFRAVWTNCLKFKDMTLTIEVLNSRNTLLYSREKEWGHPFMVIQFNLISFITRL